MTPGRAEFLLAADLTAEMALIETAFATLYSLRPPGSNKPWRMAAVAAPRHAPALPGSESGEPEGSIFMETRGETPRLESRHAALRQAAAESEQTGRIASAMTRVQACLADAPLLGPDMSRLELSYPTHLPGTASISFNGISLGSHSCGFQMAGRRLARLAARLNGLGADQPTRLFRVSGMPMRAPTPELATLFCACLIFPQDDASLAGIHRHMSVWDIVEIEDTPPLESDRFPAA